jgi:DNA-binding NarL/FixJ family response regulator
MKVLIADDEATVRSALRLLLEQKPEIDLVGEVTRMDTLLESLASIKPDIVLFDWELPGDGRDKMISDLRHNSQSTDVVVLSGTPEVKKAALRAGIRYFVCKNDPPEELLAVLMDIIKK